MLSISPNADTDPEASDDSPRTWWASADPATDQIRESADCWRIFVNLTADPHDAADRHRIQTIDVLFTLPGPAAVDELDAALRRAGFMRATDWQLGSGRGLVCWLDVAPLEV